MIRETGSKMSDCTSSLGTVCKDPACPLHFPEQQDQPSREMAAAVNLRELGS